MKKGYRAMLSYVLISLALLGAVFSFGTYMGYSHRPEVEKVLSIVHKEPQFQTTADFDSFWKAWNVLSEKSIYNKKISDQDRVWGAISGLASSMNDPYTVFFKPEENKLFNEEIKGAFGGIGAEIGIKDKVLTVIAPLKDTPAWNSGIKKGDKILKIDKTSTSDMSVDKAINLIRGPKDSVVVLTVLRPDERETREFKITRDNIQIPTVETEMLGDTKSQANNETKPTSVIITAIPKDVFLIRFYSFSENSAQLFKDALGKFLNSGSHKLILDLRGNPGGYLDSAINIASWFIDEGKVVVSEDFGEKRKPEVYRSYGPRLFNDSLQFVVLVDGGSASASEILAGALQEHHVATLIGEQTFGKGSVQELVNITDNTSLKVTVAHWLTPNGVSISEHGLTPDIKVPFTIKDVDAKRDPQMNKAVEVLMAKP